jgi:hypothetical protein
VVWLVRHITIATNTVSAAAVTTSNTITTPATTTTTTTITAAANAIVALVLLMTSQISDNIQIYWHRYSRLILVFLF